MGIYAIYCPTCNHQHVWFSGDPDQRCTLCKNKNPRIYFPGDLENDQIFDGSRWHQLQPREMIEADIYPYAGYAGPPLTIDLEKFAKDRGLPYDPTGKIDMTATFRLAASSLIREMVAGDIYPPGYLRPRLKINTPFQYSTHVTGLLNGASERINELERKLKNYEPVNTYDGLTIDQWRDRALKAENARDATCSVYWGSHDRGCLLPSNHHGEHQFATPASKIRIP